MYQINSDEFAVIFGEKFKMSASETIALLDDALKSDYDFNGYEGMYEGIRDGYITYGRMSFKQRVSAVQTIIFYEKWLESQPPKLPETPKILDDFPADDEYVQQEFPLDYYEGAQPKPHHEAM